VANCGRTAGVAWPWLAAYSASHSVLLRARIRQLWSAFRARQAHAQFSRFGSDHGRQLPVVQEVLMRHGTLGVGRSVGASSTPPARCRGRPRRQFARPFQPASPGLGLTPL